MIPKMGNLYARHSGLKHLESPTAHSRTYCLIRNNVEANYLHPSRGVSGNTPETGNQASVKLY